MMKRVKEVGMGKEEMEDPGVEPTPDVEDEMEVEGVTSAPRSTKWM